MRNKIMSRCISILICFCLLFSLAANALGSATLRVDTDSNYLKYVTGFSDYSFRPDSPVTRAQCAQMLFYVLQTDATDKKDFADVSKTFWGYNSISTLASLGVLGGYADGSFRPDANITRAEFATVLARILNLGNGKATFSDTKKHWAASSISALCDKKIIGGYPDGTFRPDATITRAEAVTIINRSVGIKGDTSERDLLFSDVTRTHWAYADIMAAASTTALSVNIPRGDVSFDEIEYITLDSDELSRKFDLLLNKFPKADAKRQAEIFLEIDRLESDIALAISMSYIKIKLDSTSEIDINNTNQSYTCQNLAKKAKERRYELLKHVSDVYTFSNGIGMSISQIPVPGDSSPDELVALYTEQQEYHNDFNSFMYSAAIIHENRVYSLSQAENSGVSELRAKALDYYVEHEKEYGKIFDNLVDVRTRIAKYYGYDTYTDIGYMMSGKYSYTPEDISVIRAQVKEYIAPLYYKITLAAQGVQNDYDINRAPYYDYCNDGVEKVSDFLTELSPQTREAYSYMQKYDMFDTESRANKTTGAFTTYISEYDTPFLFMNENGTVDDLETFAHEFGHAFHFFRTGEESTGYSTDIAEIASYGMEMLALHDYDAFFGNNARDIMLTGFYNKLNIMLLTCFLDEFQYRVYNDPDMTYKERNSLYASLFKEYFIGYTPSHAANEKGIAWSNPTHLFENPYYSIDYTLALLVALQMWEVGENEGIDRQFETYMEILESPFMDYGIEAVAMYAGLKSPLEDGILQSISEKMDNLFKKK